MQFSLNEFLLAVSFALDFVEMDILGMASGHGKRTAYISLKVAEELELSFEELHDVTALAVLHDNGISEKTLHDRLVTRESNNVNILESNKLHCIIGEENIKEYPLLTNARDIIKYHHEKYDGSGFYHLRGEEIPVMSQIIALADTLEKNFNLRHNDYAMQKKVVEFVKKHENIFFSTAIVEAFCAAFKNKVSWLDLRNDFINAALKRSMPKYELQLSFEKIHSITNVLTRIIDSKSNYTQTHSSGLSEKVARMAEYYGMEQEEKMKMIIAADLHDLGKLAVPNIIIDKPDKLTEEEFEVVKEHTYYTRLALREIKGFEEITEWASNHHEKLNGSGYPYGKKDKELDFNSRLLACLDIYEALTEERPYRRGLTHTEAMEILNKMKSDGLIDSRITEDINNVFKVLN